MDWIVDGIAIGNVEDSLSERQLVDAGVQGVLTLSDFPNLSFGSLEWLSIPLRDGPGNSVERVWLAVDSLTYLHREHPPVLVHCMEGKSRSALVVALYLADSYKWSFDEAYRVVKRRRPMVDLDQALWELGVNLAFSGRSERESDTNTTL